ncbi:MAG: hypothetical protein ISN64_02490 [Rickettsia sp.]|nr:hypothetical protein [Rickettsia sp.]
MSKKVISKNNAENRQKSHDFFFQGQKIKPVKLILSNKSFLAAEFFENNKLVKLNDKILTWKQAISIQR